MKKEYFKIYLVAAVFILLFSRLGLAGNVVNKTPEIFNYTHDPQHDKTVNTWSSCNIGVPPEFEYYFYKDKMTTEIENRDFQECSTKAMRFLINLSVYDNGNGSKNGTDLFYYYLKAGAKLGVCMEKKGYVIKEHRIWKNSAGRMDEE